jgi:hypothetical protein
MYWPESPGERVPVLAGSGDPNENGGGMSLLLYQVLYNLINLYTKEKKY